MFDWNLAWGLLTPFFWTVGRGDGDVLHCTVMPLVVRCLALCFFLVFPEEDCFLKCSDTHVVDVT